MNRTIKRSLVRQQDQSDCGAACLCSVIKYYGGSETILKLRELSGTDSQGATLLGLKHAALAVGLDAEGYESDITGLIEHNKPAILHVIKDQLEHFVVFYRYENNLFLIGDPAQGLSYYTRNDLETLWQSHYCLVAEPNTQFKTNATSRTEKMQWFRRLLKDDVNILLSSVILGIVLAVLSMATAVFSQKLIDTIIPSNTLHKLFTAIAFLLFLLILQTVLNYFRGRLLLQQNKDFNSRIVAFFYNSLLFLPKPFFDTRELGDMIARLNDSARIQRVIAQIVGSLFIDLITVVVAFVVIFSYSATIAAIVACFVPLYFLVIGLQTSKIRQLQHNVMSHYAQSESFYMNTIKGINDVKTHNQQRMFSQCGQTIYTRFQDQVFVLGNTQLNLSFVYGLLGIFFTGMVLMVGGTAVMGGQLTLGAFMASFGLVSMLIPAVLNLALMSIALNEATVAFDRMYEFSGATAENMNDGLAIDEIASLSLQHIKFRFPGRKALLEDVNFSVTKGEIVALTGECGGGKSTVAQLIERFYTPESGILKINETINLTTINLRQWRQLVGYVPQNPHIFNGAILDNLLFDNNELNINNLTDFLERHQLTSFFEQFPMGIHTLVGEKGLNLSGGQIQIVSLIRTLIRRPQLLILDEICSAMDSKTEQMVLQLLRTMKQSTAILFITHRLYMLDGFADRVLRMEHGVIAELSESGFAGYENNE
ncbi:bacteriocin cleavage/export ABC transporter [Bacteroidia bacterium]|nr:bacteriocin cleavage/export ABC transporter [Bacteroidia bacterium]